MPRIKSVTAQGAAFASLPAPAFTHHTMGDKTLTTIMERLLSDRVAGGIVSVGVLAGAGAFLVSEYAITAVFG